MILFTEVNQANDVPLLLTSKTDVLVVGLQHFGGARLWSVTLSHLVSLIDEVHHQGKKIGLFFPGLVCQTHMQRHSDLLQHLVTLRIDYILCSDIGLGYFFKTSATQAEVIFMNETAITNASDAQAMLDTSFDGVAIAVDITREKKLHLAQHLKDKVMFHLCGHHLMSTSQRPLLTAYYNFIKADNKPSLVTMRELTRDSHYYGLEDDQGFHVFHEALLVLEHPLFWECKYGYVSTLFVASEHTLAWIEWIKNKTMSAALVAEQGYKVYTGLDETDKGIGAGT